MKQGKVDGGGNMSSDRNSRTGNGKREEGAGNKIRPKREKAGIASIIYCLVTTIILFYFIIIMII